MKTVRNVILGKHTIFGTERPLDHLLQRVEDIVNSVKRINVSTPGISVQIDR